MSHRCWTEQIRQMIQPFNRMAIVGVGNELRGDDAVGVELVQSIRETVPEIDTVLFCVAGPAPENFTGVIRHFAPDIILLLDSVQMDAPPGTVCLLDLCDIENYPLSTHTLPLTLFAQYLKSELHCKVVLLGIQPFALSFGTPLSPPVLASKTDIIRVIKPLIRAAAIPTSQSSRN